MFTINRRMSDGPATSHARLARVVAVGVIAAVGSALLASSSLAATSTKVTACVNKKTGAMQYRSSKQAKKKCKKGWSKVSWNTTGPVGPGGSPGPSGPAGPSGTPAVVKDANGQTLGLLMAAFTEGSVNVYVDGGIYSYDAAGKLQSQGNEVFWTTSDCSGQGYVAQFGGTEEPAAYSGFVRFVFRTGSGTAASPYGTARTWTGNGGAAVAFSATQFYRLNSTTGACQAIGGPLSVSGMPVKELTSPADVPGPLAIG